MGKPTRRKKGEPLGCPYLLLWVSKLEVFTAISGKVVGKKVHATTPKGNMGYDQYTVSDSVAVETTIAASL